MNCRAITTLLMLIIPTLSPAWEPELMDRSVDPSRDFYRFANGTWLAETALPTGVPRYNIYSVMQERTDGDLLRLMRSAAADLPDHAIVPAQRTAATAVGTCFAAGLDTVALNRQGLTPLAHHLQMIDLMTPAELPPLLAALHLHGGDPLFRIHEPQQWELDGGNHLLFIRQGGLGLASRAWYLNDNRRAEEVRNRYGEHITRMLLLSGLPWETAEAGGQLVLDLETALATCQQTAPAQPNELLNKIPFGKLRRWLPGFDWDLWCRELGISPPETVVIDHPEYFKALGGVLADLDPDTWRAYLRWQWLRHSAKHLPTEFLAERDDFYITFMYGESISFSRQERVNASLMRLLPEALDRLYLTAHFTEQDRAAAEKMLENLRRSFRERLLDCDWMGKGERRRSLEKLERMTWRLGGSTAEVDYGTLTLSPDSYLGNFLSLRRWRTERLLDRLGKPWNPERWGESCFSFTCAYSREHNRITAVASMFQPPLYTAGADPVTDYAMLGSILAHEITHGFDNVGRYLDHRGKNRVWLGRLLPDRFKKQCKSLVKQYDRFEALPGIFVSGKGTMMENLCDLGGLEVTLDALTTEIGEDRLNSEHRGSYSDLQRFFISYAQKWREVIEDQAQERQARGPHSPTRFRALGPLHNCDRFYAAFSVDQRDPLFLPHGSRVRIW